MRLLGAFEDFVSTTLARIPNRLQRLHFIAAMRGEDGYQHWGMAKTYGKDAAQSAIGDAHSEAFEEVLKTPVQQLSDGKTEEFPPHPEERKLLPPDMRGGTRRHLSWVLRVADLLARSQQGPRNPDASR